jgi:hypothetical protein
LCQVSTEDLPKWQLERWLGNLDEDELEWIYDEVCEKPEKIPQTKEGQPAQSIPCTVRNTLSGQALMHLLQFCGNGAERQQTLLAVKENFIHEVMRVVYHRESDIAKLEATVAEQQNTIDESLQLFQWTLSQLQRQQQKMREEVLSDSGASTNIAQLRQVCTEDQNELSILKKKLQRLETENQKMKKQLQRIYGDDYLQSLQDADMPQISDQKEDNFTAVVVWVGCRYNSWRWYEFVQSFLAFEEHFNSRYKYPIVIFHEGDYTPEVQAFLRGASSGSVNFEVLELDYVPTIYRNLSGEGAALITAYNGYKNMCRFFSGQFFEHPALLKYNYYWRLDTDSFLLEPVPYDVFKFMHKNKYVYGWHTLQIDLPEVTQKLGQAVRVFLKENPSIKPKDLDRYFDEKGEYTRESYLNNFEISNFAVWRTPEYKKFYEFLERAEGFWRYRWGDAPVHSLAVAIFLEPSQIYHFSDINYKHRLMGMRLTNKERE